MRWTWWTRCAIARIWCSRELNEEGREAELIDRLRQIYRDQGIEVPDHMLAEGVKALKDSRFVYTPRRPSWKRTLLTAG